MKKIISLIIITSIFTLNGCSTIEIDPVDLLIGSDSDDNQCLLAPLDTNEGLTLPEGTRGRFIEKDNKTTFITYDVKYQHLRFHDITGKNWSMRSCSL